jgi:hypothetical protein
MKKKTKFEIGKYYLVLSAASYAGGIVPSLIWERTAFYANIIAFLLTALFFTLGVYFMEEGGSDD